MDLQNTTLNINCHRCGKKITLTFNTIQCPKCGEMFDPEAIKRIFYNYESRLANSKAYKVGNAIEKTGNGLNSFGIFLSSLGCVIMGIPLLIILVWFILSMLKS